MTSRTRIDAFDLKILDELQRDGRCTNTVLARRVGLSESSCSQRLRRLEKGKVIKSYRAIIDQDAIAPRIMVLAQIKLTVSTPAQLKEFEKLIVGIPEIVECDLVTGEFDYLLRISAPDMPTYLEIADRAVQQFKGIKTWVSNVVLRRVKDAPLPASRN